MLLVYAKPLLPPKLLFMHFVRQVCVQSLRYISMLCRASLRAYGLRLQPSRREQLPRYSLGSRGLSFA